MIRIIKKYFSFDDMLIYKKFMIGVYTLLISMTLIFIFVVYLFIYIDYEQNFLNTSELSFKQADNFICRLILPLSDNADVISSNNIIQNIYKKDIPNSAIEELRDMLSVEKLIKSTYKTNQGISSRLYVDSNYTYANQNYYFGNISSINKDMYKEIINLNKKYYISEPYDLAIINNIDKTNAITFYKAIRNNEDLTDIIALVGVSVEENTIRQVIENANITKEGLVILVNDKNEVISHSGDISINYLSTKNKNNETWEKIKIDNYKYYYRSTSIIGTNWTLMAFVPYHERYTLLKKINWIILIILCIYLFFTYKIVSKFSLSFTSRTTFLAKKMIEVKEGNFDINIENTSKDEIGMLYDSFNYLINEIDYLLKEQYNIGIEIKNMELLALQSQINPHFLYNTLDVINWMALDSDAKDVVIISQKLASFYKFTLNQGKSIIQLKDELSHIELYTDIQNYRFNNKITLNIDVSDEIKEISVPKLLLQPIVENAIVHGIFEKESNSGYINISATKIENKVTLSIVDNGKGIDEKRLKNILIDSNNNYGVNNINARLKLLYGKEYGLEFRSAINVGTTVDVILPYDFKHI